MTDSAHDASDRAVLWLIRKGEPDWSDEQEQEFETWLGESMLHRAAYLRQREGWRRWAPPTLRQSLLRRRARIAA
jgi:ferric-dicitrate binding protein FerR (iron transport regulator)